MEFSYLQGKVALVTGASRRQGIGAAICRALATQGVDIALTYWQPYDRLQPHGIDEEGPLTLEQELRAEGVRAMALEADLSRPEAPARLIEETVTHLGYPHILVNNAAHSTPDGYQNLDAAILDAHYAVNLRGMALLSVEFAKRWPKEYRDGRIVNLTSGQSLSTMPNELAYAATKGAAEAFTRTLAVEVATLGITVSAIDPEPTDTGWMSQTIKSNLQQMMRMGRVGLSTDAAQLALFLASAASGWITGQVIHSRGA